MARPDLTDTEKDQIRQDFENIISKAPIETYQMWKKEGSFNVINRTAIILPEGIEGKLKGKLADEFVTLLNRNDVLIP